MTHNQYDTILCDLGNVLINFDHRIAVRKILEHTPKGEEDIYNLFFDSGLTELYEEGKIDPKEFFRRVKEFLKIDIDQDEFFPIWNEIFFEVPLNKKMHEFLKNTKNNHKLVMVSNLNITHFEHLRNKMDIFDVFDKLILSYEVGRRKPASEIYEAALDSVGTKREKSFYIDDRRDLIEVAAKMGIKGIVFDGDEAFRNIKVIFSTAQVRGAHLRGVYDVI